MNAVSSFIFMYSQKTVNTKRSVGEDWKRKALLFCTFDERRELHEEVNKNLKLLSAHHCLVLSLFQALLDVFSLIFISVVSLFRFFVMLSASADQT